MKAKAFRSLVLVPGLLAGLAVPAARAQEGPGPVDRMLSPEAREAFVAATRNAELWKFAQADAAAYMKKMGVHVPEDIGVAFLDMRRFGDTVQFDRPGELFGMYCPPERTWFSECAKVIRACDKVTTCVRVEFGIGGWTCVEFGEVEKNCAYVCEQFIWDEKYVPATRPFYPPLPRALGR
jgi:hypothetical protein